jgi:hypothetical protein
MTRTGKDPFGDRALHVFEELRIAAEGTHQRAGEEDVEDRPPAAVVPDPFIELQPCVRGAGFHQGEHPLARMRDGEDLGAEEPEVVFEFPAAADAALDGLRPGIPEIAGSGGQQIPAFAVEGGPAR